MNSGLMHFVPFIIYFVGIIVAFLSILVNPLLGVLFLFPLLPYQNIFEKIYAFPVGNNLNDIIICSIFIGWLLRKGKSENTGLGFAIFGIVFTSLIGTINAISKLGLSLNSGNTFLADWKNYMLLPLLWFLTYKNVKDKKTIQILVLLLVLGIIGADYYFYTNIKWMNLWHYSDRTRNMMEGLFVYLGPNHYGAFFVHFLFVLLGIFLFSKSKIIKAILLLVISFTIYCLIYTYSRGAYLAIVGGLLFVGLLKDRRILIGLIVFALFWRVLVPISVSERIDMTKTESGELEDSAAIRIGLWQAALTMFNESPIIGHGFSTFQYNFKGETWRDTHNYYLKMLVELGIFGLVAFIFFMVCAFRRSWLLYRIAKDPLYKGLGFGFAACIIAAAITNFFGDRWTYLSLGSYFWIFLGIVNRAYSLSIAEVTIKSKNGKRKKGIATDKQ